MSGILTPRPVHEEAPAIAPFSADADFDYEIRGVLGLSSEGASEIGEVLAATSGVRTGDHDAWFDAWERLAAATARVADAASADGHRVSAAEAHLRASTYFAVAVNALSGSTAGDEPGRLAAMFGRQQAAWDAFVAHTPAPVERVAIPYQGGTLPGWLFAPPTPAARGATLVAVNGSDGPLAAMWASCVAPGLRRGYRVFVFDGPGQQSQLFAAGTTFRPDWEHVLTPVYDALAARPDVDAGRIAVYGISQGGNWVARALAFEHRFAAAITDPGVVDVSTSWTAHIPKSLLRTLDAGDAATFDREMAFAMRFSPDAARTWRFRARPYGADGYAATLAAVRTYSVADVVSAIATPLLVLSPEHEQFWPGQAELLAELTPSVSTVVGFTAAEGAGEHCQPLARVVTAQRMFDWLDDRLTP